MPDGSGFALLGGTHLAVLAGLAVLVALLCVVYIQLTYSERPIMLKALALVILGLEAVKQASFPIAHGRYFIDKLPLHLCGLVIFLNLVYAWYGETGAGEASGEILYALGLPGSVCALVFANWSMYPLVNFDCMQSFVIHALHIAFVVLPLVGGELRPRAKNLWKCGVFLVITVPIIYVINLRLGTNFFFVNAGSPGSPLEALINLVGVPWFIIPYAGLVLIVWAALYLPWELASRRRTKYKVRVYSKR
jgi:hypothetical integral membrane protein (TIGR02206 family)